jgi:DNA helicase-2/ATP-dependent DNA helicase PcrA
VSLFDNLTPAQAEAVRHREGPLLVLAGPGSGKTRVVTRRIAALVESGVPPHQVLAITFTNKAAGEMQERVEALLPGARVQVSTFHRFCARTLRHYAALVGLQQNFTILDTGDQKQLLRQVLNDLAIDTVHFPVEKLLWRISAAKNELITPELYRARFSESVADHWQSIVNRAYPAYQKSLLAANAVDFDDLLVHVALLLTENAELRERLDARHRYVLVDEYQDTNAAQYRIAAALSQRYPNLCVTGDPDQSIYGWRGARIENILRFEREFPGAKVVRLEENFRSTGAILRSADRLISHNTRRKAKALYSSLGEGEPVRLWMHSSAEQEADDFARRVRTAVEAGERRYDDFAVFYRVNALSRLLELALARWRIPFQVAAGFAFYERAEIKDLLAYLRLIENPQDRAAFSRVVNTPLRGLGQTSQDKLTRWADREGLPALDAAKRAGDIPGLSKRAIVGFKRFAELMKSFSLADSGSVASLLERVIDKTAYTLPLKAGGEGDQQKLENVHELVTAARSYDRAAGDERSLQGFLEQTSLVSDTDSLDTSAGQVTLMTLHAAKGLEFPVVQIVGVEQGLLPHERSIGGDADAAELEEERRLLFVGMTRARQELHLSYAHRRMLRGQDRLTIPSLFLSEIESQTMTPSASTADADIDSAEELQAWARSAKPAAPTGVQNLTLGNLAARLTTGADLLNGTRSAVELPTGFAIGSQVRHPRYGQGVVTGVSGLGSRKTITVRFQSQESEQSFVAAQAPLQPIGH